MLINGAPAGTIPATDRGLAYGDGVFRTLIASRGEPGHWRLQYAKLARDCATLGIACPEQTLLLDEVRRVARAHPRAVVKITVTRGSGPRGYAPPQPAAPLRIVASTAHQVSTEQSPVDVYLCRLRLAHQPALAGAKHLNRLENVLARTEWSDPNIREGLLLDQDGCAIGGTMSNLFIVEAGVLITPALDRCGVAGVTRERVIRLCGRLSIACRIEPVPLQRVLDASEVFFVNSVIGLWPVARLGERVWSAGSLSPAIQSGLKTEDDALV